MTVSQGVIDTFGALGGALLAACLVPQVVRIYTTRSARDLSYIFLVTFTIGLTLMIVYLIFEEAIVGWALSVVELAILFIMIISKIYFDNWGPYAHLRNSNSNLSIATKARLELHRFLAGTGGAAFPLLLQPTEEHGAAHLLLDCLLPSSNNNNNNKNTTDDVEVGDNNNISTTNDTTTTHTFSFNDFVDLLEICLENSHVDVIKRYTQSFPSFRRRSNSIVAQSSSSSSSKIITNTNTTSDITTSNTTDTVIGNGNTRNQSPFTTTTNTTTTNTTTPPNMAFISCIDGYATAMWFVNTKTLAIDFVGASDEVIGYMNQAAEEFCRQLNERYKGTRIAASSIARLPTGVE